jgi:large subunit ribosomal protein L15
MDLSNLEKLPTKKKRRLGMGHGSGRGKTGGRGTKGTKARGSVPLDFEGGALPLMKRLPFLRGKGKFKVFKPTPVVIPVDSLNVFAKNDTVDRESLIKHKLIPADTAKRNGVKILGGESLTVALTVKVPVSKSAAEKIKTAGGSVENGIVSTK